METSSIRSNACCDERSLAVRISTHPSRITREDFRVSDSHNRSLQKADLKTFDDLLASSDFEDPKYVTRLVESLLTGAGQAGASDLHFQPTGQGLQLKWRVDGVLQPVGVVPAQVADNVVVRLKVLAKLLTYQTHLPQEGRIAQEDFPLDIRISTFPTVFGEKVVARFLPTGAVSYDRVGDLGLPAETVEAILAALSQTSGILLIVGPAGSGKTTTAYACLREILSSSPEQRNIASMEDPVEVILDQVAQSEVAESVGFDLTSGLRSLVRQDPDVIFVGEIRDPETASIALQAALTGQLVITTFHAPDASAAMSRLADMGVPAYVLRSATNCVLGQQLVRRLCDCAKLCPETDSHQSNLGLRVETWRLPQGCPECRQSGYRGRQLVAELLDLKVSEVASQISSEIDAAQLRSAAAAHGMKTLYHQAVELVQTGKTSPAEVVRVFGITDRQDELKIRSKK